MTFIYINAIAFSAKVIDVIKEQRRQEEIKVFLNYFSPIREYISCVDGVLVFNV